MVYDDAVFVVDDLGLVAELDRSTEPTLHDRTRIGIMQRHDPGGAVGCGPGETLPALLGDLACPLSELLEAVDLSTHPTRPSAARCQLATRVADHTLGLTHGTLGDPDELAIDPAHRGHLVVVAAT